MEEWGLESTLLRIKILLTKFVRTDKIKVLTLAKAIVYLNLELLKEVSTTLQILRLQTMVKELGKDRVTIPQKANILIGKHVALMSLIDPSLST